jgi:peptidoglycan/LPS O-acetylase OafA/YrhL
VVDPSHRDLHHASTGYSFPFLDGVRGLAIVSVVTCHTPFAASDTAPVRVVNALMYTGAWGVSLFFVLSGFLITLAVLGLRGRADVAPYLLRRAGKILPPFYLVLLLDALLLFLWKGGAGIGPALLAYATTYAHFTPRYAGFDPVCWSLFIEIHFYLLLPLLYLALRRVTRHAGLVTGLIFLTVPAVVRFTTPYPLSDGYTVWFWKWNLFPRGFDFFAPGILLAVLFQAHRENAALRRWAVPLAWVGAGLLVLSVLAGAYLRFRIAHFDSNSNREPVWEKEFSRYLTCAGTFLLLFLVFARRESWLGRALTFPPLRYAGLISYELYLIHLPILNAFGDNLPVAHGNIALQLCRNVVPDTISVGLAALIYHFFSAPTLGAVKRYARTVR